MPIKTLFSGINPYQLYESVCKYNKESIQRIKWGKSFDTYIKQMAKKDINGKYCSMQVLINLKLCTDEGGLCVTMFIQSSNFTIK